MRMLRSLPFASNHHAHKRQSLIIFSTPSTTVESHPPIISLPHRTPTPLQPHQPIPLTYSPNIFSSPPPPFPTFSYAVSSSCSHPPPLPAPTLYNPPNSHLNSCSHLLHNTPPRLAACSSSSKFTACSAGSNLTVWLQCSAAQGKWIGGEWGHLQGQSMELVDIFLGCSCVENGE